MCDLGKSSRGDGGAATTSASEGEGSETPAIDALAHPHVEYEPDPVVIEESTPVPKPAAPTKVTPIIVTLFVELCLRIVTEYRMNGVLL